MKQNKKIAFCAIMAALSAALMAASFFPYLTYAVPAAAGIIMMIPLIEIGAKYAFLSFAAAAGLTLLFAEPEAAAMYVCFLGYYPILKAIIERRGRLIPEWIIKLLVFNTAVVLAYTLITNIFGLPIDEMGEFGKYGLYILLIIGNITFVIYDIALSRLSALYMMRLHKSIKKYLK